MRQQLGYRPILPDHLEGQTPVLGAYGPTGLTQLGYQYQPSSYDTDASFHMSPLQPTMSDLGMCSHGHAERLFPQSNAGTDNSETQALNDLHEGIGDSHDL
jgi:hypothetical protein